MSKLSIGCYRPYELFFLFLILVLNSTSLLSQNETDFTTNDLYTVKTTVTNDGNNNGAYSYVYYPETQSGSAEAADGNYFLKLSWQKGHPDDELIHFNSSAPKSRIPINGSGEYIFASVDPENDRYLIVTSRNSTIETKLEAISKHRPADEVNKDRVNEEDDEVNPEVTIIFPWNEIASTADTVQLSGSSYGGPTGYDDDDRKRPRGGLQPYVAPFFSFSGPNKLLNWLNNFFEALLVNNPLPGFQQDEDKDKDVFLEVHQNGHMQMLPVNLQTAAGMILLGLFENPAIIQKIAGSGDDRSTFSMLLMWAVADATGAGITNLSQLAVMVQTVLKHMILFSHEVPEWVKSGWMSDAVQQPGKQKPGSSGGPLNLGRSGGPYGLTPGEQKDGPSRQSGRDNDGSGGNGQYPGGSNVHGGENIKICQWVDENKVRCGELGNIPVEYVVGSKTHELHFCQDHENGFWNLRDDGIRDQKVSDIEGSLNKGRSDTAWMSLPSAESQEDRQRQDLLWSRFKKLPPQSFAMLKSFFQAAYVEEFGQRGMEMKDACPLAFFQLQAYPEGSVENIERWITVQSNELRKLYRDINFERILVYVDKAIELRKAHIPGWSNIYILVDPKEKDGVDRLKYIYQYNAYLLRLARSALGTPAMAGIFSAEVPDITIMNSDLKWVSGALNNLEERYFAQIPSEHIIRTPQGSLKGQVLIPDARYISWGDFFDKHLQKPIDRESFMLVLWYAYRKGLELTGKMKAIAEHIEVRINEIIIPKPFEDGFMALDALDLLPGPESQPYPHQQQQSYAQHQQQQPYAQHQRQHSYAQHQQQQPYSQQSFQQPFQQQVFSQGQLMDTAEQRIQPPQPVPLRSVVSQSNPTMDSHKERKLSDKGLDVVLRKIPVWHSLAINLGVPFVKVQSFIHSSTGGMEALQYWRDGMSGESFAPNMGFLLVQVTEVFGYKRAEELEEILLQNEANFQPGDANPWKEFKGKNLSDFGLHKVADLFPNKWGDLAVALGVPVNQVEAFRALPSMQGTRAIQYWRDGRCGEQFPGNLVFLLETVSKELGHDSAQQLAKKLRDNPTMIQKSY